MAGGREIMGFHPFGGGGNTFEASTKQRSVAKKVLR